MRGWVETIEAESGVKLNMYTLRKRRALSGLGLKVPPRMYMLTREEFTQVMNTPLPMCHKTRDPVFPE